MLNKDTLNVIKVISKKYSKCIYCGEPFNKSYDLSDHIENYHWDEVEKGVDTVLKEEQAVESNPPAKFGGYNDKDKDDEKVSDEGYDTEGDSMQPSPVTQVTRSKYRDFDAEQNDANEVGVAENRHLTEGRERGRNYENIADAIVGKHEDDADFISFAKSVGVIDDVFICPYCITEYPSLEKEVIHLAKEHADDVLKVLEKAKKDVDDEEEFARYIAGLLRNNEHKRSGEVDCPYCGKRFPSMYPALNHVVDEHEQEARDGFIHRGETDKEYDVTDNPLERPKQYEYMSEGGTYYKGIPYVNKDGEEPKKEEEDEEDPDNVSDFMGNVKADLQEKEGLKGAYDVTSMRALMNSLKEKGGNDEKLEALGDKIREIEHRRYKRANEGRWKNTREVIQATMAARRFQTAHQQNQWHEKYSLYIKRPDSFDYEENMKNLKIVDGEKSKDDLPVVMDTEHRMGFFREKKSWDDYGRNYGFFSDNVYARCQNCGLTHMPFESVLYKQGVDKLKLSGDDVKKIRPYIEQYYYRNQNGGKFNPEHLVTKTKDGKKIQVQYNQDVNGNFMWTIDDFVDNTVKHLEEDYEKYIKLIDDSLAATVETYIKNISPTENESAGFASDVSDEDVPENTGEEDTKLPEKKKKERKIVYDENGNATNSGQHVLDRVNSLAGVDKPHPFRVVENGRVRVINPGDPDYEKYKSKQEQEEQEHATKLREALSNLGSVGGRGRGRTKKGSIAKFSYYRDVNDTLKAFVRKFKYRGTVGDEWKCPYDGAIFVTKDGFAYHLLQRHDDEVAKIIEEDYDEY